MLDIVLDFLQSLFLTSVDWVQKHMDKMMIYAFSTEAALNNYMPYFSKIYLLIYQYAAYIIIVKFLAKGINTYVLWQDGDPDQDPIIMLTGFFKAIIGCLCFGELYHLFINIVQELLNKIMKISKIQMVEIDTEQMELQATYITVMAVLYIAIVAIMAVIMIINGYKLLLMRLGFPLASMGMLDADGGSYKPYIKMFFQMAITIMVQVFFLQLSWVMIIKGGAEDILYALASAVMAFVAPGFLQQFVMQGSQIGQKITSGLMAVSSMKRIIH